MAKTPARPAAAKRPVARESVELVPPPIQIRSAVQESPRLTDAERAELEGDKRALEVAKRRYKTVIIAERRLRGDMLNDRKHRVGRLGDQKFQWPQMLAIERNADKRPVLQVNRIATAVAIHKNAGDDANLRIQVNPVDDAGDVEVAQVIAGLIRNVETRSFAEDDAYSTAGDAQCEMGRGYIWLSTEYESDESWRQRAVIERVLNPFRVKVDAAAQKKDQSDGEYAFYDTDVDHDTWKELYGRNGARPVPTAGDCTWAGDIGDQSGQWFPSDKKISVKHYFFATYEDDVLYELSKPLPDGRVNVHNKDIETEVRRLADAAKSKDASLVVDEQAITAGITEYKKRYVKRSRPIKRRIMNWWVIDALYVHEKTTWPTPWQPFIPMVGEESEIDGDHDYKGVTRDSIDPQMIYNVEVSSAAEAANDAPKAPWVGPKGTFGKPNTPTNDAWCQANRKRYSYLEYEVVDIDGKHDPRPVRTPAGADIAAYAAVIAQADNDIKATTRTHEASLAERGPQESGRAVQARQRQDEIANSHFTRNRRRCLASAGRQLIYIFRTIYDVATVVRITMPNDQKRAVMVFTGPENDPRYIVKDGVRVKNPEWQLPSSVKGIYDIGVGEYDVEVTAAPKPGTRREQDLNVMVDFTKMLPPQYTVNFMDLLFKLIDSPIGRQLSERADKLLRPDLRDVKDAEGKTVEIPPEVMAQITAIKAREQELIAALKEAQETIKAKRIESASREQIATMNAYVELVKMLLQEMNADSRLMLEKEIDRITMFMEAAQNRVTEVETAAREAEQMAAAGDGAGGAAA